MTGVTTPNKTAEGWSASLHSPKEAKEFEKENWGDHHNPAQAPVVVADGPIIESAPQPSTHHHKEE